MCFFFFFNDTATTEIYTLSLHDALPIYELLVSEIAGPFDISLQAVSKHIQVLVRAGLVRQERTGRVSRCSLVAGPIFTAAVWLNRYSKYWQQQFDLLAATFADIDDRSRSKGRPGGRRKRPPRRV